MLMRSRRYDEAPENAPFQERARSPESLIDFDHLFAAIRRQMWIVLALAIIGFLCGVAFIVVSTPLYTASTLVLIDNRRIRAVENVYDAAVQGADMAASIVESQVEVAKSENVAIAVIRKFKLLDDPRFANAGPVREGFFLRLRHKLFTDETSGDVNRSTDVQLTERYRRAGELLRQSIDIHRVGRTMVLEFAYTSADPDQAALIANAYADAYLSEQLNEKYEATRRASVWLEERMNELKQKALSSDHAVQRFKEDFNLISSGGRLVDEQQLAEVSSQLVTARAETSRAEARYERISSIINGRQTEAIVPEAIGNQVIEQMRSKYIDVSKREAELSVKLGGDHQAVVLLRGEKAEYEKLMFDELSRLSQSYRSDLEIAQNREKSLKESFEKLMVLNATANKTQVALRELEREGEAYRSLYQTYLQRYQESLQQQSFPIIDARVIASALKPNKPAYPKKQIVLAFFLLLGATAGGGIGLFREFRERGFLMEDQLQDELGLECLGFLPLIKPEKGAKAAMKTRKKGVPAVPWGDPGENPPWPALLTYSIDNPMSRYSETLRSMKLACDLTLPGDGPKVIGIISVLPREGKSVVSKNLASLISFIGPRTLVIDGDLRNPSLTRTVAPGAKAGLVEAVLDDQPIKDLILVEERSNLSILPAVVRQRLPHTSEFLSSPGMKKVLAQAQEQYDYVIIDLPPMGPVVDVRAIAPQIDAFLLVVEWRRTARKVVRSTLAGEVRDKCVGVVLNKVSTAKLKLYESYGSKHYYHTEYTSYHEGKH
jgi:polysaccharide biosynthesis transport protein